MNDVYCSNKFNELEVHIQSRLLYNCCKAYPERIDLKWLENNPGQLFNTPTMIKDRDLMLSGSRCQSCYHGCYQYEDRGLVSGRIDHNDRHKVAPISDLKTLKIALSTDCNLTCAYCSAEWSSAWNNDLSRYGDYGIKGYDNKKNNWNDVWKKIKQKDRSFDSKFFNLIKKEIQVSTNINTIYILGGEPLLNNNLLDFLEIIKDKKVIITTGLGITSDRLDKILSLAREIKDLTFDVSIESTGRLFEFIRYGCSWKNFQNNLDKLLRNGSKIRFGSVISNLSSFGIIDFFNKYNDIAEIMYNPVTTRPFLEINVLDDQSKSYIETNAPRNNFFDKIRKSLSTPYKRKQKDDLKNFLLEFSKRRKIDLTKVFPDHFLKWVNII